MNARWAQVDPRLYFVTDSALCVQAGRSVAATAAAAVAGGAGIVQVRDKQLDDAAFYALTRSVLDAVASAVDGANRYVPVVLNDRVNVARRLLDEEYDVHIHVGQQDTPVTRVRERLGPGPLVGLSVATLNDLATAEASGVVDLVGLSPVFDTATKPDAGRALRIAGVRALARRARLSAFAIGGITVARTRRLRNTGIAGVCVASALCLAADPAATARAFLAEWEGTHV